MHVSCTVVLMFVHRWACTHKTEKCIWEPGSEREINDDVSFWSGTPDYIKSYGRLHE